jgi:dihydrofolate reductase
MRLIVSTNRKGYIGKNGGLLCKSKEDMKHFKNTTMGGILIVGKTTYEKDLKGRPLKGRELVVVGEGYYTLFEAVEKAIKLSWQGSEVTMAAEIAKVPIWVIGGGSIYKQLVHLCEEIHLSIINNYDEGDVKFEIPTNYHGKVVIYNFEEDKIPVI